jgi:hypothetical protein
MTEPEWNDFMQRLKALPPLNNKPRPVDTDFWREMDAMQTTQRHPRPGGQGAACRQESELHTWLEQS